MVITDVRDAESSPALVLAGSLKAAAQAAICKNTNMSDRRLCALIHSLVSSREPEAQRLLVEVTQPLLFNGFPSKRKRTDVLLIGASLDTHTIKHLKVVRLMSCGGSFFFDRLRKGLQDYLQQRCSQIKAAEIRGEPMNNCFVGSICRWKNLMNLRSERGGKE